MRLSDELIKKLYIEYNTPPWVIGHCKEVSRVGVVIAEALNKRGLNLDVELIRVAGLAHDVLRTKDDHDLEMGKLLDEMGYPEEANMVRRHMRYSFNPIENINENDIMCLADRLVKEDKYVGIQDRVDYLIHKPGETKERTERLRAAREKSKAYISQIEDILGYDLDSLFIPSDELINHKLERILKRVEKPARYIGGEKGIYLKTGDLLRFAFAFPDIYEIGMSYMGLQILYEQVNKRPSLYMERVFEPAPDMSEIMREERLPLFTLESKTPIKEMDVFGFTLQYEMSFTNILDMLDLAGIPKLASERRTIEKDYNTNISIENQCESNTNKSGCQFPLIIAGGPCAYNPEPLADFVDVFLIGDGEELLPDFLERYKAAKDSGLTKEEFFKKEVEVRSFDKGIYIPSICESIDNGSKDNNSMDNCSIDNNSIDNSLSEVEYGTIDKRPKTRRAFLSDINTIKFPENPIVPFIETVHDREVVEAFRGCTRGCRFCQAGMIYRPVRERTEDAIMEAALGQIKNTGHDELSLLSLSSSDYSGFESLAMDLTHECMNRNVALSLPSLRLDTFSFSVLQEIQKYRKSGLTFAPEAGTQRLRDVINKGITEEDIYSAVRQAIELGWTHIKLYFMIGLPTETYEDLDGIANIAKTLMSIKNEMKNSAGRGSRFTVTVSVSNFVPKAHTPFQWAAQDTAESFREKHNYLREKLRIKGVTFNYHDDDTSVLEAIIARGDRRVGELILNAYSRGCRMDSWSEHFDRSKWDEAMKETGVLPEIYATRERDLEEELPWDVIDSGISIDYLKSEWKKASEAKTTRDCRYGCTGCGVNRYTNCPVGGIYAK